MCICKVCCRFHSFFLFPTHSRPLPYSSSNRFLKNIFSRFLPTADYQLNHEHIHCPHACVYVCTHLKRTANANIIGPLLHTTQKHKAHDKAREKGTEASSFDPSRESYKVKIAHSRGINGIFVEMKLIWFPRHLNEFSNGHCLLRMLFLSVFYLVCTVSEVKEEQLVVAV